MGSIRSLLMAVVVTLTISSTYANVFFKGKPVHGGTTANCPVDVKRLMWGSDDMGTGDRIQGQIQVGKTVDKVQSLKIIIQGIDATGSVIESFALTLSHGGISYEGVMIVSFGNDSRYPFLGVVFLRHGEINKDLENAWFFFDFPQRPEIKNFLVVNMVLNDREVPYNLRLVGNRLSRSLSALPHMKKSGKGNFFATTEWVPPPAPTAESELVKKPSKPQQTSKDITDDSPILQRNEDEISGVTTYSAPGNWRLAMNGATFSLMPSVLESEDKSREMTFLLSGNSTVRLGYSMRLEKILFFDPETKNRCTIEKESSDNWPSFYLSSARKEVSLKVTDECVRFLSEAAAIRCRFSFGTSDMPSAKNYDFAFSMQQVSALRALAQKCLGKND